MVVASIAYPLLFDKELLMAVRYIWQRFLYLIIVNSYKDNTVSSFIGIREGTSFWRILKLAMRNFVAITYNAIT